MAKIEDIHKKARSILEKYKVQIQSQIQQSQMRRGNSIDISNVSDSGSKHSHYTNSSKKSKNDPKTLEITDRAEKIFILTLMTFH